MELTQEDVKNILVLIGKAPLVGNEATTVAVLQRKLSDMLVKDLTEDKPKEEQN